MKDKQCFCQMWSPIQQNTEINTCFVVFEEIKKHADSEYHFIVAKSNDISEDLNSVAVHCSSTTGHQGPREEELRLAKQ